MVFNLGVLSEDTGPAAFYTWIIERESPERFRQTVTILDQSLEVLSSDDRYNNGYDPRLRGWYHAANNVGHTVRVPPYVYYETLDIGITMARRTGDGIGVVGGDLTLATLSTALANRRDSGVGRAIIFDDAGGMLAADDMDLVISVRRSNDRPIVRQRTLGDMDVPEFRAVGDLVASGVTDQVIDVSAGGTDWSVWMSRLSFGQGDDAWISIVVPSAELFSDITKRMRNGLAISAAAIAISVFLAWSLGRAIARPIRAATQEAY